MVKAAIEAVEFGFRVEILSNCYWATCPDDAVEWLRPISRIKNVELTLSSDFYHGENWETEMVRNAVKAAHALQMKADILAVKDPHVTKPCPKEIEGVKVDLRELMY